MTKEPWSKVYETNIMEFFNCLTFCSEYESKQRQLVKNQRVI